ERTDTYSPAAIDMAPATVPAMPAERIAPGVPPPAATPTTRPATDTMPSLAPSTAARSQPARSLRWDSTWRRAMGTVRVGLRAGVPSVRPGQGGNGAVGC